MNKQVEEFMKERYGPDQLGRFLLILSIVFLITGIVIPILWIKFLFLALFVITTVYMYFRMFSKSFPKRYEENRKYTLFIWKIKQIFKKKPKSNYKIVKCKKCKQKMRVKKGQGTITIRCPECKNTRKMRV